MYNCSSFLSLQRVTVEHLVRPGLGARCTHHLRHLAQFRILRARLRAPQEPLRRGAELVSRGLRAGIADAELQRPLGGLMHSGLLRLAPGHAHARDGSVATGLT